MTPSENTLLPDDWLYRNLDELAQLAPLQQIELPAFQAKNIRLSVKREDLLHPKLGGNKLYKLYGHIHRLLQEGYVESLKNLHLATFGGAWSNHIYALAAVGQQQGIRTTGFIRGDDGGEPSQMLIDARNMGMNIHFLSRADYRRKHEPAFLAELELKTGSVNWIPEGGGGAAGAGSCAALMRGILAKSDSPVDVVAHAVGSATTLAGLSLAAPDNIAVVGVAVLKARQSLESDLAEVLKQLGAARSRWTIWHDFHCGGYAKLPEYLLDFMRDFENRTKIQLDPVYTAKLMYGMNELAKQAFWPEGTHVVVVHSGGLQGCRGMSQLQKEVSR